MAKWYRKYDKGTALLAGLLLLILCLVINPLSVSVEANRVLSIALLMISWWVTDAVPMPVVALLPIILFPLFHIASVREVTKSYSDSVVFLFMGGFFIGIAIEKWNLHKRIALSIINLTGTNGNRIILGFIIATGFLSLWLSNTATTMMMFPIAMSVIHVLAERVKDEKKLRYFSVALLLSIAYASNFALGTIIGTPPNVAYVNYIAEKYNFNIGFTQWMVLFMPLTILLLFFLYWVINKLYPNKIAHTEAGKEYIKEELYKLGKISIAEKRVLFVFLITVLLWICKDVINSTLPGIELDDTIIALFGAGLLFVLPSGQIEKDVSTRLLEWHDTHKMAWGILILFGGGIALAKALEDVKLLDQLGNYIAAISTGNTLLMIFIITTLSVFLSEVMSNVAQVIVMAPVVTSIAVALHIDPLLLGVPMTLGASCAGMLPMGTPPNAIVFASGHIRLKDMLLAGFIMNIISIIMITLFTWLIQPYIFHLAG